MVDAFGVGGAGAFGALASAEEEVVDITFLPPKPKKKEKKEREEKATVQAAADAAEEAAEDESGAVGAAAASVVVRGGKLRDLEVLSIWSDHLDKTLEEAIAGEATTDAIEREKQQQRCPLMAAMLSAEEVKAEEAAAVATEAEA